jgi:hypothetical protein
MPYLAQQEAQMADGWAVKVTIQVMGGGQSEQIWYAHVPDRTGAEEAVKRRISATPDVKVEAVEVVSHNAFAGMNVAEGAVSQW